MKQGNGETKAYLASRVAQLGRDIRASAPACQCRLDVRLRLGIRRQAVLRPQLYTTHCSTRTRTGTVLRAVLLYTN